MKPSENTGELFWEQFYQKFKEVFKLVSLSTIAKITDIRKDTIKTGKNMGKEYYKVYLDGQSYPWQSWTWTAIKDIRKGHYAKMSYDESADGRFKTILQAELVQDTSEENIPIDDMFPSDIKSEKAIEAPAPPRESNSNSKPRVQGSESVFIHRQVALKAAVEWLRDYKDIDGCRPDFPEIIDTAREFYKYIENG